MSLTATITIGSQQFLFDSVIGIDAGDYIDPQGQFVQGNIIVSRPDTSLSVEFRRDRNSTRVEIVVSSFKAWNPRNAAAANLDAYTCEISDGQTALATVQVPRHCWGSRWRWNPTPRPVRTTPAALIAAKLIPNYASTVPFGQIDWSTVVFRQPMDTVSLDTSMDSTGDRSDIGPLTEWSAQAVINPTDAALRGILAQGEAAAGMPLHIRDEQTNAPIDFDTYVQCNWYGEPGYNGSPWIKTSGSWPDRVAPTNLAVWGLDYAHFPEISFLPFLLTGDPYHLEELQYQLTWKLGFTRNTDANNKRLIPENQARGWAWTLRDLFAVTKVTQAVTPSWLKPKAYWQSILDANLKQFTNKYVNDTTPVGRLFHTAFYTGATSTWQEDFVAFVLGWGVLMGFAEWRPAFQWKLGNTLARTNGTSGWPRQWCSPYHFALGPMRPCPDAAPPGFVYYASWAETWDGYANDPANNVLARSQWPDTTSYAPPDGLKDYLIYTRGVLALAAALGEPAAQEPFVFVDAMVTNLNHMTARWSVSV